MAPAARSKSHSAPSFTHTPAMKATARIARTMAYATAPIPIQTFKRNRVQDGASASKSRKEVSIGDARLGYGSRGKNQNKWWVAEHFLKFETRQFFRSLSMQLRLESVVNKMVAESPFCNPPI